MLGIETQQNTRKLIFLSQKQSKIAGPCSEEEGCLWDNAQQSMQGRNILGTDNHSFSFDRYLL